MSRIGRFVRGIVLLRRHDMRRCAYLKRLASDISIYSFHTKAQRAVAVRSRCQRTAPALELAPLPPNPRRRPLSSGKFSQRSRDPTVFSPAQECKSWINP